jgi:crotonobetainyl-CoA:carnitine CoA-transferase CaiB-like acyl-CoA transferase
MQPLSGLRALDLTRLLPGGLCTLMLADLGADVLKIEDPSGGDYLRWGQPLINDLSAHFHILNRNKRSAILDLKQPDGAAALKRLVAQADVLVEGFRPGVMARLGLGYDTLRAVNPRLVYCAISGWGADGPYADRSGHDLNYLAVAGLLGGMETPNVFGGQVADMGGAYIAVSGILAALLRRERAGEGSFVDASLFESALPLAAYAWAEGASRGAGALTGGLACYRVYRARDGQFVSLAALEPKFWDNFCRAVERPDLIPDYLTPSRQSYLRTELEELFALKPASEWASLLEPADCCFAVVRPPADLPADPQIQARGSLGTQDGIPWLRSPVRLNDDAVEHTPAPRYGQHTRAALREVGYADADIDALAAAGVVREG